MIRPRRRTHPEWECFWAYESHEEALFAAFGIAERHTRRTRVHLDEDGFWCVQVGRRFSSREVRSLWKKFGQHAHERIMRGDP